MAPKNKGICEPITLAIVAVCFVVGGYFALRSKQVDAPAEQAAEAVLKTQGIDIDFSADKKKDLRDEANGSRSVGATDN